MTPVKLTLNRAALEAAIDQIVKDADADIDAKPWDIESARAWHCAYLRGMQRLFVFSDGPGYAEARSLVQAGIEQIEKNAREQLQALLDEEVMSDCHAASLINAPPTAAEAS